MICNSALKSQFSFYRVKRQIRCWDHIWSHSAFAKIENSFQMTEALAPYAFLVSTIAILVSILAALYTKRTAKLLVEQRLTERESRIIDAFVEFKVRSPFAHRLSIPKEREAEYTAKAVMLLHQVNLFREVFENRDLVSPRRYSAYASWASSILRPWIESDDDLKRTFALIIESENTHDREFIEVLRSLKVALPLRGEA